jgi:hypothetical protein
MDGQAVTMIARLALVLAVGFAIAGFFLAPGNAAVPTSLAFTFIAMLGIAVGRSLRIQAERLAQLEHLLRDRSPSPA